MDSSLRGGGGAGGLSLRWRLFKNFTDTKGAYLNVEWEALIRGFTCQYIGDTKRQLRFGLSATTSADFCRRERKIGAQNAIFGRLDDCKDSIQIL